jgi:disulfide bond formation protein DsbB
MTNTNLTIARAALITSAVMGAALAGAYIMEYGFKILPCPLCLEQRQPYFVAIPLGLAVAASARWQAPRMVVVAGLALLVLVLLWSTKLGVFHAGVEWGFWPGPADCAAAQPITRSASGLLSQLSQTRVISCTEAAWRFFGTLSLAGFNALISLALASLCAAVALSIAIPGLSPRHHDQGAEQ